MKDRALIREYTIHDKEILINILKSNVPQYFDETEIEDYKEYLDNKIEKYFVIEQDDKIIGAGGINFSSDMKIGKISWDFIQVDYHGKGLGKQLLDHRIQLLKSINTLEQITVRTSQFAYKFYEKQGFKLLEIKKDFWANGIDLYFMKLE